MPTHTMRWTALPAGLHPDGRPVVSAHAGFRLDPGPESGVLGQFPAAVAWWSTAIDWTITFRRGDVEVEVPATLRDGDRRDGDLWQTVFSPSVPVRAFVPPSQRTARRIRTFRTTRMADRWRATYGQLARTVPTNGDHLAIGADPATGSLGAFEALGFWDRKRNQSDQQLAGQMEAQLAQLGWVPSAAGADPTALARRDTLEFRRFLERAVAPDGPDQDAARPWDRPRRVSWVEPPQLDVHELVTACAAHAALLRPLGLVFDLVPERTLDEMQRELAGPPTSVRVTGRPAGTPPDGEVVVPPTGTEVVLSSPDETTPVERQAFDVDPSPWTACALDGESFRAVPLPGSDLSDRLFAQLGDPSRFRPIILDVEGATLKAMTLAGTLQLAANATGRRSRSTPTTATAPTVRTGGIGIARIDRSEQFHRRSFQRGDAIVSTPPGEQVLHADDVLRGWRLDVRPTGAADDAWRSLVRRRGELESTGGGERFELTDAEGWISETPVGDAAGELYLGEEFLRWDGWSPVAPKPGAVIGPEDDLDDPDSRDTLDHLPDLPVRIRYQPTPGTLLPLRYGRRYDLRARAVDIGGNGPGPESQASAEAAIGVLFGRLDGVASPDVLLTEPRRPGEELDRVILRSPVHDQHTDDVAGRFLIPPRTTVVEAERHGVLDDAAGRPSTATYEMLAVRDAYSVDQDERGVIDPDDPVVGEGASRYFPGGAAFSVGYLPDPLARSIRLRRADGTEFTITGAEGSVPVTDGVWPDTWRSVRLRAVEASLDDVTATYDAEKRVLEVGLPKAETLELRLSSAFGARDLALFGLTDWLADAMAEELGLAPGASWDDRVQAVAGSAVGTQVINGDHWMFSPWRPLTLVHAVKQPLRTVEFRVPDPLLVSDRERSATASQLSGRAIWHAASTGRLDLRASWDEGIDLGPGAEPPEVRRVEVLVAELDRSAAAQDPTEPRGMVVGGFRPVHEHGDTKYREITYELESTTAFAEHFVETATVRFASDGSAEIQLGGSGGLDVVESSVELSWRRDGSDPVVFRRDDGDGGDFRSAPAPKNGVLLRQGEAVPIGEDLTVRFLTRPITKRSPTSETRVVKSSARPLAPVIDSVLPTFAWSRSVSGRSTTSRRAPAGVRVWLDRPWWSSGLGEQLGVVIRADSTRPGPQSDPYVTRWGRDPIHAGGNVSGAIGFPSFPLRANDGVVLRLPGSGVGETYRVIPHDVHFDADRDRWFCDIDLDLRSYWPFVRLALARFQPHAISDPPAPTGTAIDALSLSPVVLADIVQLAPDRVATVTVGRLGRNQVIAVSLTGPSFTTTSVDTAAPVVRARLERRPVTSATDLDWSPMGPEIELVRSAVSGSSALDLAHTWTGRVSFPVAALGPSNEFRIVLEEIERYRTDGRVLDGTVQIVGRRPILRPMPRDGERVVHLDIVPLSAAQLA